MRRNKDAERRMGAEGDGYGRDIVCLLLYLSSFLCSCFGSFVQRNQLDGDLSSQTPFIAITEIASILSDDSPNGHSPSYYLYPVRILLKDFPSKFSSNRTLRENEHYLE